VQQPVRKRRLPVVNVGDDAEISYVCGVHYFSDSERDRITGKRMMKRKFSLQQCDAKSFRRAVRFR
jgi:hypothetical protein